MSMEDEHAKPFAFKDFRCRHLKLTMNVGNPHRLKELIVPNNRFKTTTHDAGATFSREGNHPQLRCLSCFKYVIERAGIKNPLQIQKSPYLFIFMMWGKK